MLWETVLEKWKKGIPLSYPKKLNKPFLWRTSIYKNKGKVKYNQEFIECSLLDVDQDYSDFEEYIKNSDDSYVTSFYNLSKDTILIIPIPKKNKDFSNLKNFIDQASITQQKKFWKHVASIINYEKERHQKIWVSTHGTAVPYLHVRVSSSPKYYGNSKLLK